MTQHKKHTKWEQQHTNNKQQQTYHLRMDVGSADILGVHFF